jgi:hypothetical protein
MGLRAWAAVAAGSNAARRGALDLSLLLLLLLRLQPLSALVGLMGAGDTHSHQSTQVTHFGRN